MVPIDVPSVSSGCLCDLSCMVFPDFEIRWLSHSKKLSPSTHGSNHQVEGILYKIPVRVKRSIGHHH